MYTYTLHRYANRDYYNQHAGAHRDADRHGNGVHPIALSDREQQQHLDHQPARDHRADTDRDVYDYGQHHQPAPDDGIDYAERQQFIRIQLDAVLNDQHPSDDLRNVAGRLYDLGYQLNTLNSNPIDGHKQLDQLIIALGVEYRKLRAARDTRRRDAG